jgi:hypothetical protein
MPNHPLNRTEFVALLLNQESETSILEIGPLNRPLVSTPKTKYFDLHPTQELKSKAIQEGLDPHTVPHISFFDPHGNLGVISEKFDNIVSAHCIEHQPDLIEHFVKCSKLLEGPSSRYYLVVPDKRYCFDALIPESSLIDILKAHEEGLTQPSIWKVIEHRALTTHNHASLHWQNDNGIQNLDIKARFDMAKLEFENARGTYIDVHCWQFTPNSLRGIIEALFKLGVIDFEIEEVWETPKNDLEFCAVLKKRERNL